MKIFNESEIKEIEDHFGMHGAIPYIYTRPNTKKWFILHWKNEPAQVENYSCNKYISVNQKP